MLADESFLAGSELQRPQPNISESVNGIWKRFGFRENRWYPRFINPLERWLPVIRLQCWHTWRRRVDREVGPRVSSRVLRGSAARRRSTGPGRPAGSDWCLRRHVQDADWSFLVGARRAWHDGDSAVYSSCLTWYAVVTAPSTPGCCTQQTTAMAVAAMTC